MNQEAWEYWANDLFAYIKITNQYYSDVAAFERDRTLQPGQEHNDNPFESFKHSFTTNSFEPTPPNALPPMSNEDGEPQKRQKSPKSLKFEQVQKTSPKNAVCTWPIKVDKDKWWIYMSVINL